MHDCSNGPRANSHRCTVAAASECLMLCLYGVAIYRLLECMALSASMTETSGAKECRVAGVVAIRLAVMLGV